ncbi:MAG: hypothetical protein WCD52_27705 [Xanthobacteraceae bacterium]
MRLADTLCRYPIADGAFNVVAIALSEIPQIEHSSVMTPARSAPDAAKFPAYSLGPTRTVMDARFLRVEQRTFGAISELTIEAR